MNKEEETETVTRMVRRYCRSVHGTRYSPAAGGFKCAWLWKVYGDEEKARSLFEKYRKCTEIYCTLWQSGLKLEQLAVAV